MLNAMPLSPYAFEQLGLEGVALTSGPMIVDDERALARCPRTCLDGRSRL